MRINGLNNVGKVYKPKKASKAYGSQSVQSGKDQVTLSDFAKDLQVAKQAVQQAPDVRTDKVNDLKQQMEAGQYNVSASMIADKLLSE